MLGAAFALAGPGREHVPRLQRLAELANFTSDRIVVAIATGRSLERDGLLDEAIAALTAARDTLPDGADRSEPMLQLAAGARARRRHRAGPVGPADRAAQPARDGQSADP